MCTIYLYPVKRETCFNGAGPVFREADPAELMHEYGIKTMTEYPKGGSQSPVEVDSGAIILPVSNSEFKRINLLEHKKRGCVIYDVKGMFNQNITNERL